LGGRKWRREIAANQEKTLFFEKKWEKVEDCGEKYVILEPNCEYKMYVCVF
jgi:hypothetical protein